MTIGNSQQAIGTWGNIRDECNVQCKSGLSKTHGLCCWLPGIGGTVDHNNQSKKCTPGGEQEGEGEEEGEGEGEEEGEREGDGEGEGDGAEVGV